MAACYEPTVSSHIRFAQTLDSTKNGGEDDFRTWLSSSFPVLSNLLDKVLKDKIDALEGLSECPSEKSIKELVDLFPPVHPNSKIEQYHTLVSDSQRDIPVYTEKEKFDGRACKEIENFTLPSGKFPNSSDRNFEKGTSIERPNDCGQLFPCESNLCYQEYHIHHKSESTGLLQICKGSKYNIYRAFNPEVREMDALIFNPETNICSESAENLCTLKLPGAFSYNLPVKELSFRCSSQCFDVFGLLILIIDSIYALNCVSTIAWNRVPTPLEFTHDIVKALAIIRSSFPKEFQDLQKLVMYSTVCTTMRKAPLSWNRCMVHVFEDLIINPLSVFNEDTVEFKLLGMIMRKRAKALCNIFSEENSNIFNSFKHQSTLASNFKGVFMEEIAVYLKTSALNCHGNHRVKNIRYELKDKSFRRILRDIYFSYC